MNREAYKYYLETPPSAGLMRNAYELGAQGIMPAWLERGDSWAYAAWRAGYDRRWRDHV